MSCKVYFKHVAIIHPIMMLYNSRCHNNIILGILITDVSNILCILEILYVEYIIQMKLPYRIEKSNVKKNLKHLDVINILFYFILFFYAMHLRWVWGFIYLFINIF